MLRAVKQPALAFATPRKLPKAASLAGRVVVLDIAFASEVSGGGFEKVTLPLIHGLGERLAMWIDHHDHVRHADYAGDPRFLLSTKAEHGACPEMVTPECVVRAGPVDTIVCHTDFDGLASAAKWIRGGVEPYPGADDDARAIDTRVGKPSPVGLRFDRAIRARWRDHGLLGLVVRHLAAGLEDPALWVPIDEAARELAVVEERTRRIAERYRVVDVGPGRLPLDSVAFLDATRDHGRYDKTALLLAGQSRATVAVLVDGDNVTLAAPFDSGLDFLALLGLSGGMPTLVSVPVRRTAEALSGLGVAPGDAALLLG